MLASIKSFFIGLFFQPDADNHGSPQDQNINFEDVFFMSGPHRLHGVLMKPAGVAKGTIIHCHGNDGNVTCQYELSAFLTEAGFNVLCFDYQGYGRSPGKSSPESIIDDTRAAIAYLKQRSDIDPHKLALFGQSLGAAAACGAMKKAKDIQCIAIEGAFTTYKQMAFAHWKGRLLFFITPFVIPDMGPLHDVAKIAPRPLFIIHGDSDGLIPARFSKAIYNAAREQKSLLILKGFRHISGPNENHEYKKQVITFFDTHLAKTISLSK